MEKLSIGGIFAILLVLVVVVGGFSSVYTVDEGKRGVITRNGALTGTAEPGMGFKMPFVDSVNEISIQSQTRTYGERSAYSRDQQSATMGFSVTYHIPAGKVVDVYQKYRDIEGLNAAVVDRLSLGRLETVFGQFNAESAIQKREQLVAALRKAITDSIPDGIVVIDGVEVEDISFSKAYDEKIESRMAEEIEVTKRQQSWEKEKIDADITKTRADAAAYEKEAMAKAEAASIRAKGLAEAEAINAKGKALRDNPALVDLTYAEQWNGVSPTTVVPNSSITGLNIGK